MKTVLPCPCGVVIQATDEDELVDRTRAHFEEDHPGRVDKYSREEILFLAY